MVPTAWAALAVVTSLVPVAAVAAEPAPAVPPSAKVHSVFFPPGRVETARRNAAAEPWARTESERVVRAAKPWLALSDDDLWALMFGATITRSWMVWSNGVCPACQRPVPMYNWEMDALQRPWKVRCPHCHETFPKNDFGAFYRSGLDAHGVFDPARADRSLLVNAEHAAADDPRRGFGVDDGEGYVEGDKRWRFIGAYLVYGQWKQAVLGGIQNLAAAYVLTGDRAYAHKAAILLDRVADVYPSFDFGKQALVYEVKGAAGYVSTWHDACVETRQMVYAYDMVFTGLEGDDELVRFLSEKARRYGLPNPKASVADIRRHIEAGILRDTLASRPKIQSNYPQTDITLIVIHTVLGWPENREAVYALSDPVLAKAVAVDGVTGEKGLAGYAAYAVSGTAGFLAQFARLDPGFLADMLRRHPRLHDMFRFHVDTWCLQQYYPTCGDSGSFARRQERYAGLDPDTTPGVAPSLFAFLGQLAEVTGDPTFWQLAWLGNGSREDNLPYDLFAADPAGFRQRVREAVAAAGPRPTPASVDKREWHLAILRAGRDAEARALWLDYDSGGAHSHADGLNLGLYAYGLDLLPDFGYPPVNYGGWGAPRAVWYTLAAAHNTVVVDGHNPKPGGGQTTLWADGDRFQAVRAAAPDLNGGARFERTAVMVGLDAGPGFYVLDLFRVAGGTEHTKFVHSHFGRIATQGLNLAPAPDYGRGTQMRAFAADPAPAPGWSADWTIDDRFGYLPAGTELHLRYTDLSQGVRAGTAEAWVATNSFTENADAWVPRLLVSRQAEAPPLASTFLAVLEPYVGAPAVRQARRLPLADAAGAAGADTAAAVLLELATGQRDLFVLTDRAATPDAPAAAVTVPELSLTTDADLAWVRLGADGRPQRAALCRGRGLRLGAATVRLKQAADLVELDLRGDRPVVLHGPADSVE